MKCIECGDKDLVGENQKRFCSRSCSARYNNRNRQPRTEESRRKTSDSIKKTLDELPNPKQVQLRLNRIENLRTKGRATKIENLRKKKIERLKSLPFDSLNRGEKRQKIFEEQNSSCLICGLKEWLGKPITLELDHIDGNRKDETRSNLRLICPNCHSQTDTYKHLNRTGKEYSEEEIVDAILSEKSIYKSLLKLGMNTHGGNYTRLRNIARKRELTDSNGSLIQW